MTQSSGSSSSWETLPVRWLTVLFCNMCLYWAYQGVTQVLKLLSFISGLYHAKDLVMWFHTVSVGVFCFQARQVLHLSFQCGHEAEAPSPAVLFYLGAKQQSRDPYSSRLPWAPLYQWPIPASHQPNYSRCVWGTAMELGLCAMQGRNLVHKFF